MSKYILLLDKEEISLIRTLLIKHRDLAIAKVRFYEYLDINGEYHSFLEDYRELKVRYESILKKLIIKENDYEVVL